MKRNLGRMLLLIGLAIMLVGLGFAFQSFATMYLNVIDDPLAEKATAGEPEQDAAKAIFRWAAVGIAGAPIAAIGAFLTMKARIDRMRARQGRR